jgi:DNA (cytosine-5)-methyltransferase 1
MGRYRQSYLYRCPRAACRNAVIEPPALAAAEAIDWADPGKRIGGRARPLAAATLARIAAGLARYARPFVLETTWHDGRPGHVHPAGAPLSTQDARQSKALACPPLLVPAGGTWRGDGAGGARPVGEPMPARTARETDGVAFPPGALLMRNNTPRGNPAQMVTPAAEPMRTLAGAGSQALLVPYYGNAGTARPVTAPAGTMTAADRYALASGTAAIPVDDVLFRMLKPPEIGRAMAFGPAYVVLGTQREKVRQYGNAVTPPVAEILISALAEAITGTSLEAAG